ncbi:hypothetical protein FOL47_010784 [Perkinsus chesapeaki]|uniref:Uncharacterized protein n=1 Tax=Perkinsus chesapeaki TaxID=330153 RepID=A0A7J6MPK5_PERCH|nr:hypothetical protein FOL47_010784 [Perkinsus chesapeaki]
MKTSSNFLLETIALTEMELETIRGLSQQWDEDNIPADTRYYSHEHDGRYSALEYLRRYTFDSMQDIDKGILRYAVRHVFKRGDTIADFGSGISQWAEWLNNTGYVTALAYDGVPDVDIITSGQVTRVDLAAEHIDLGLTFNWGLVLNVLDTISTDLAARIIKNIASHCVARVPILLVVAEGSRCQNEGVILSWAGVTESADAPSPMDSASTSLSLSFRTSDSSTISTTGIETLPCHNELSAADVVEVHPDPMTRIPCNTSVALEKDRLNRPFCFGFAANSSTSAQLPSPFLEVELKAPYVIRGFELDRVYAREPDAHNEGSTNSISQPLPKSIKINAAMGVHAFQWYRDMQAREHSIAWTSLNTEPETVRAPKATVDLETDFRGHLLRVWPRAELVKGSDTLKTGFQIKLYGCPVKDTRTMQLRFRSSFASIRNKFKTLDIFRKELISHVCRLLTLSTASSTTTCSRILFIDVAEKSAAEFEHHRKNFKENTQRIDSYEPSKDHIPNVVVNLRVLPPVTQCVDCRSASEIVSQFREVLETEKSTGHRVMAKFEEWVTDDSPYFCSKVQCLAGQDCVNGVCIDKVGLAHDRLNLHPVFSESGSRLESGGLVNWDRENRVPEQKSIISNFGADIPKYRYDDTLLQLKPLPLIKGADQPPQAHFVAPQSVKSSTNGVSESALVFQSDAEPASSEKAFHRRYTFPLLIAGSLVALLIIAVCIRKARGISLV